MKILLDEDSQGRFLARLLRDAGHDVETVTQIGLAGRSDPEIFAYAQRSQRVLITRNAKDFRSLHKSDNNHFGILVEYKGYDKTKDMTYEQIAEAITKIDTYGINLVGEFMSINLWR